MNTDRSSFVPLIPVPENFQRSARISTQADYERMHTESIQRPDAFWRRELDSLDIRGTWTQSKNGSMGSATWFDGAETNVSSNCLEHQVALGRGDKTAILWEGEDEERRSLSYSELTRAVEDASAALRAQGIASGDRVIIYMGMVPEAIIAMLACARIGAIHSVIFGGFAKEAVRDRIVDSSAKLIFTQNASLRRGKEIPLFDIALEAAKGCDSVKKIICFERLAIPRSKTWDSDLCVSWNQFIADGQGFDNSAQLMPANAPLFLLYTSGSTGKPKGIVHSSLGYLAGAHLSSKYIFDLQDDDVYWCTADIGWITGHSYIVYGPLSNGATCVVYEGAPNEPDWSRFWQIIERYSVSVFYTAPTAIRAFMKAGDSFIQKHDLSSLRLLGSVGEPISPEAWTWFYRVVGAERCPVVDTFWQTETGSITLTTLPGVHAMKPGTAGVPFFGIEFVIVDDKGTPVADGEQGLLTIREPWPSMLQTVWNAPERFQEQYMAKIPGSYFTGDGAMLDEHGYIKVLGRVDDVLNVSGHRIGTAEIEAALGAHPGVAESAVVSRPDDLKGEAIVVFVVLKESQEATESVIKELRERVAADVGRFALPDVVKLVPALPKTRSGKIIRRLLKAVAAGKPFQGDLSTLEDPSVLEKLQI